jgi:hypothetical protein
MSARETSLNPAVFLNGGIGLFWCWMGIFLFDVQHPYGTGFISLGFLILGAFFLSVTRIKLEDTEVKYRRWLRWNALPYSEIRECGESWVYGYIRPRLFAFPWGKIYFVRPYASNSLFGLDKEMISAIRAKAKISVIPTRQEAR